MSMRDFLLLYRINKDISTQRVLFFFKLNPVFRNAMLLIFIARASLEIVLPD